ncbi:peptide methionine sulfoxide reductase [gamma proteobacterium IMCC1989]|nr:peptide methionine sulfoxide reductase [gamma proteobacterium IMCC1989]
MRRLLFVCYIMFFTSTVYAENQTIIVAGGCFWCVESDYEKYPGVLSAESGYINGSTKNPTYRQVASKKTGHYEVVKITYNPDIVSAKKLVDYFWLTIDPTDDKGQFCDKGSPYKTALFYQNSGQEKIFRQSLADIEKNKPFDEAIVTKILPAETFYTAEDYHQDYYKKSSLRYKYYRASCGRDARIKKLWGEVASKKI